MVVFMKPGRKPLPPDRRKVRLQGSGPFVSPETERILEHWRTCYGVTIGQSIESLLAFAKSHPDKFRLAKGRRAVSTENQTETTHNQ
jgi:hypothetical protein